MKKLLLSFGVLGVFLLYAFHQQSEESAIHLVAPQNNTQPTSLPTQDGTTTSGATPPPTTVPQSGKYKDGQYTGDVTDAFYGPYQVRAVVTEGKITDIVFLQTPGDRGESIQINSQASPILRQEAIRAQSENVDIVSGATQSSGAFIQSLKSALAKAKS
jgi:uncharacterized protein with FMN-binding domain